MRELTRALNLRGGSLYSHITSKEELLWEITNRVADHFLARAAAVAQDVSPQRQLELLVRGHITVIARDIDSATVFFQEWKLLKPDLQEKIKKKRDHYEAYFHSVIEEGKKRSIFRVENVYIATRFVLSALNWTVHCFHQDQPFLPEQLADQYLIFIMRTLTGKK
jgi:AcrR family transcriptional regulator